MSRTSLPGEVAAALARIVFRPETSVAAGAEFPGNEGLSALEAAEDALIRLGVAENRPAEGAARPGIRVILRIDLEKIAARVGDSPEPPALDVALSAWLKCMGQFGPWPTRREPFVPPDDLRPLANALVEQGYARRVGEALLWSDKIGPAMRDAAQWNEANLSLEEIDERDEEIEMRQAFATIPDDVRRAALDGAVIFVMRALASRWIDGAWIDEPAERRWWKPKVSSARRLVAMAQRGSGAPADVN